MCLHAEGFSQEVLHALPSTMRALAIPDGKSHFGRQHQAKFLEALLVKSPQLLSIISRTHADVEAPANSSKIRITNLTLNPVFVNSVQALWQGQSGELGPGTTLSFARNQGDDTPHHFLVFQLQALDAGLQSPQSTPAEAETKAAAGEHQPQAAPPIAPTEVGGQKSPPTEQPPPPPSAMAMTTVDVAKVAIPTEVLQQLRAVETCKLDSPKPKNPPREPSPDPSPDPRSHQASKVPPEPRSFPHRVEKEKKVDPRPEALQPEGKEPIRPAPSAVDAKAALDPVAFEETLPVAPAPTLGPCPVLAQLPEEVAVEDPTGATSIEPHITLELNGAGVKAEASLAARRLGSWALSSPLAVGRRHQADQLRSVIVRECLQFISRDHFAVEFRDAEVRLTSQTPNPMWRFRQGSPPLEFGREESVALEDGDAVALGTGVGDALATAEDAFARLRWTVRLADASGMPWKACALPSRGPSSPGGPGPRPSFGSSEAQGSKVPQSFRLPASAVREERLSELCCPDPRYMGSEDKAEKFMPQARLLPALGGRERREPHFGLDDEDGLEPHWTSAVRQKVADPARSRPHRGWA